MYHKIRTSHVSSSLTSDVSGHRGKLSSVRSLAFNWTQTNGSTSLARTYCVFNEGLQHIQTRVKPGVGAGTSVGFVSRHLNDQTNPTCTTSCFPQSSRVVPFSPLFFNVTTSTVLSWCSLIKMHQIFARRRSMAD